MRSVEAQIIANGERSPVPVPCTVAQFLAKYGWRATQVVVEYNGEALPRSQTAQTFLKDGDRLEVIVPVAGG